MKKRALAAVVTAAALLGSLTACSGGSGTGGQSSAEALKGNIVMRGSSALYPLMQQATQPFLNKYTKYNGNIDCGAGEGSGAGLDALINGTSGCNIGNSDVTAKQAGKNETGLIDHQVAVVAVAIVVSPDVAEKFQGSPIKMSEVLGIYNGMVKNWKEVSGSHGYDKNIAACYRKKGSGTRTLFQTYGVPGTKFDENKAPFNLSGSGFKYTNASSDLSSAIQNQQGCIGYETLPYCGSLKKLPVLFDLDATGNKLASPPAAGVECTYANVNNGTYKIWGYEHMYTKGEPAADSAVKSFLDFVTSSGFKDTIQKNGYGTVGGLTTAAKENH